MCLSLKKNNFLSPIPQIPIKLIHPRTHTTASTHIPSTTGDTAGHSLSTSQNIDASDKEGRKDTRLIQKRKRQMRRAAKLLCRYLLSRLSIINSPLTRQRLGYIVDEAEGMEKKRGTERRSTLASFYRYIITCFLNRRGRESLQKAHKISFRLIA